MNWIKIGYNEVKDIYKAIAMRIKVGCSQGYQTGHLNIIYSMAIEKRVYSPKIGR
jgi:hypothetical protein